MFSIWDPIGWLVIKFCPVVCRTKLICLKSRLNLLIKALKQPHVILLGPTGSGKQTIS